MEINKNPKTTRGGQKGCGKELSKEYMKKRGTLCLRCTNNIYIKVLCEDCQKLNDALQKETE